MVTAAVAAALGESVTVDLAWRHTDLGVVHTGRGAGRLIWRGGSLDPLPLDLAETGRGSRDTVSSSPSATHFEVVAAAIKNRSSQTYGRRKGLDSL